MIKPASRKTEVFKQVYDRSSKATSNRKGKTEGLRNQELQKTAAEKTAKPVPRRNIIMEKTLNLPNKEITHQQYIKILTVEKNLRKMKNKIS